MKMLTEKNSKRLLRLGLGLFIIGVILFLWNESLSQKSDLNSEKVAQFGDFIGGIIGSIWSLAGVILFYVALTEQREDIKINRKALEAQVEALNQQIKEFELQRVELGETRKVFIEQSETLKIQRFENTFFQLFSLHHELVDKLSFKWTGPFEQTALLEKRAVLSKAFEDLQNKFTQSNYVWVKDSFGIESSKLDIPKTIEIAEVRMIEVYKELYFDDYKQILSHYFRNVYHIYKFILTTKLIEKSKKQFYASLVRAQLSSDELYIIFYNSMHHGLGYPNFLFLIKEFDIMQNFDFRIIDDKPFHREIYNEKLKDVKSTF